MSQNIMAINAGSSSLKFQLFAMPEEHVITKGLIERIGKTDAIVSIEFGQQKLKQTLPVLNHQQAVDHLLKALLEHQIIRSLSDISGVGHRVAHGGEIFKDSSVIVETAPREDNFWMITNGLAFISYIIRINANTVSAH